MSVMRPELIMKSIIPVVMAGIIAIYGLVVAVLIAGALEEPGKYTLYKWVAFFYEFSRFHCESCDHRKKINDHNPLHSHLPVSHAIQQQPRCKVDTNVGALGKWSFRGKSWEIWRESDDLINHLLCENYVWLIMRTALCSPSASGVLQLSVETLSYHVIWIKVWLRRRRRRRKAMLRDIMNNSKDTSHDSQYLVTILWRNLNWTISSQSFRGFIHLGAGLSVGFSGLAAGFAIGIVGDAGVRGTAQQPRLFVGMILILIFAEVLGLYGLIVAIYLYTK